MGSDTETPGKLKAIDLYYYACEFCAYECNTDHLLKDHLNLVHKDDLWVWPCPNCESNSLFTFYSVQL